MTLCPECGGDTDVKDSRQSGKFKDSMYGNSITRRKRKCKKCQNRFTTYELPVHLIQEFEDRKLIKLFFKEIDKFRLKT